MSMMRGMSRKKSNLEAHERLMAASDALGSDADYETVEGRTAIAAARSALLQYQLALMLIIEKRESEAAQTPD